LAGHSKQEKFEQKRGEYYKARLHGKALCYFDDPTKGAYDFLEGSEVDVSLSNYQIVLSIFILERGKWTCVPLTLFTSGLTMAFLIFSACMQRNACV
jgi:hypothetical protein